MGHDFKKLKISEKKQLFFSHFLQLAKGQIKIFLNISMLKLT
jgi:hypothetical protein